MPIGYAIERIYPTADQLAGWTVDSRGYDVPESVEGACPKCGDECAIAIQTQITDMTRAQSADTQTAIDTLTEKLTCNCGGNHSNRPAGITQGCGRWWLAEIVRTNTSPVKFELRPAADDSMLLVAQAVDAALVDEQSTVTGAAEKWLAGVTALYGIFSLTGIAVGKDTLTGLETWVKIATGISVGIGVIAAALAVFRSYQAAYGWPRVSKLQNDEQRMAWYRTRQDYLPTAAKNLKRAVISAVVALSALVAAVGFVWFGPTAEPAAPHVSITGKDDTIVCGTLLDSKDVAIVRIRKTDGSVVAIAPSDIAKIAVKAC